MFPINRVVLFPPIIGKLGKLRLPGRVGDRAPVSIPRPSSQLEEFASKFRVVPHFARPANNAILFGKPPITANFPV